MQFDMREFLNVLSLAFEEPEFTSELGLRQRQRVVDILLQVVVLGEGFLPSQVGSLFTFLARQMAKPSPPLPVPPLSPLTLNEFHQPTTTLQVESKLFERVVEYLAGADGNQGSIGQHEERQQALLELFGAGGLDQYDPEKLLQLCLQAKFYRVCELLYEQRGEHGNILLCYLQDPLRKHQVYSYLQNVFASQSISKEIEPHVVENIKELVDIDSRKAGQLIATNSPHLIPKLMEKLKEFPSILYQLLIEIFQCKSPTTDGADSSTNEDQLAIDPLIYEQLLSLMCIYEPKRVRGFLEAAPGFRLDETYAITKKHGLVSAMAYVLELMGNVKGAFDMLLEQLNCEVKKLIDPICEVDGNASDKFIPEELMAEVREQVVALVDLCRRGSGVLDENSREALWMGLLEGLLAPQRKLQAEIEKTSSNEESSSNKSAVELLHLFKELTHNLLSSMVGLISLPKVIHTVMKDPAYRGGKFGEIRGLLIDVLENCSQEKAMLATTGRLLGQDLHDRLAKLLAASRRGVRPLLPPHHRASDSVSPLCSKCCCPLDEIGDEGSVIAMRCGHCYHNTCLSKSSNTSIDSAKCIHCSPEDIAAQAGELDDQKLAQKNFVQHGKPGRMLTLEQIHSVEEWFEFRKSLWREGTHISNSESTQWKMEYSPARRGTPRHADFIYGDSYE